VVERELVDSLALGCFGRNGQVTVTDVVLSEVGVVEQRLSAEANRPAAPSRV